MPKSYRRGRVFGRGRNGRRYGRKAAVRRLLMYKNTACQMKMKPELKYADTTAAISTKIWSGSNAALFKLLNGIAQGDGPSNRDGQYIIMKSLSLRLGIYLGGSQTEVAYVRFGVLLDGTPGGAMPTNLGPIFNTSASGITAETLLRNLDYTSRFSVLYDQVLTIGYDASDSVPAAKYVEKFIKLPCIKTTYVNTDTSANITAITQNSLIFYCFGNYADTDPKNPEVALAARLRYYD